MKNIYLTYAKRTPIGKINGSLSAVRPDDLMAHLIRHYSENCGHEPSLIDEVVVGCANQAGEDNRNIARMATLLGGLPNTVPAVTLNRLCASSLDAMIDAAGRIELGIADCVLVGGVESMTRAPLVISKASKGFGRDSKMFDTSFGWRFPNPQMEKMFPLYAMGETAENLREEYPHSRQEQDEFAFQSHQKAIQAQKSGLFNEEILPLTIKQRKSETVVDKDENPRADTNVEKLSTLRPVFKSDGTVTAGNASSLNDGAALLCLVSEEFLKTHSLTPIMKLTGMATAGVHPNIMGIGPVAACQKLSQKFGINLNDMDAIELNEAFAIQALAVMKDLGFSKEKVNLHGGAIALGHPLGCSGARIVTTLTGVLQANPTFKKALATMCVGVGQGVAVSFERA